MTDQPRGPASRAERAVLAALVLFSAGLGLACILEYRTGPLFTVPIGDEDAYVSWAQRIASGDLIGHEVFYQDPLYPYLLGALFAGFGRSLFLVRVLQAALGAAIVYFVYWTGRRMMSGWAALAGAAMVALYGGLYFFELLIIKTTLEVALSAAVCALGVWAAERPGRARMAAVGGALGVMALLRGNVLMIAPLAAIWAALAPPAGAVRDRLARGGALAGAFLLVLLPVSGRNYAVSGEFVLTTSQGGSNFYIGNNSRAEGAYTALESIRSNARFQAEDFRELAERQTGQTMTGPQASRYWFEQAWRWMRAHPADAARLWLKKAFLIVNHYEVPDNQSFYLVRREFAPAIGIAFLGFGWFCGPALAGMALLLRREPKAVFPAGFAIVYAVSLMLFYVVSRYRLPLLPSLAPFAGFFLSTTAGHLRRRELRPVLAPAGLAAALLIAGLWPRSEPPVVAAHADHLLGDAYLRSGQPGEALRRYDLALAVLPDDAELLTMWQRAVAAAGTEDAPLLLSEADRYGREPPALQLIGQRLEALGMPAEAITVYERALSQAPDFFPALARLAWLYASTPGHQDDERAARDLARAAELRPDYRGHPDYAATAAAIAAAPP